MKAYLFFPAFFLVMFVAACQKDVPSVTLNNDEAQASERCGCLPPGILGVQNITSSSAELSWEAMPEAIAYRIEVSNGEFGVVDDRFAATRIFETTNLNKLTLSGLYSSTGYKYRVTTICGSMESVVSSTFYFVTKKVVHGDPGYSHTKAYGVY